MRYTILAAAAAASLLSAPVLAQDTATTTTADTGMAADPAMMTTEPVEDDNEFPWGLLGLLGLAGLLGRKRDDHTDTTRRTT